jgi:hypothetical protein
MDARGGAYHRDRWTARLLACLTGAAVNLLVGNRVRFHEPYRPPQVRWAAIGVIVDVEERSTQHAHESWVRARFPVWGQPEPLRLFAGGIVRGQELHRLRDLRKLRRRRKSLQRRP